MKNKGLWHQLKKGRKLVYSPPGDITEEQVKETMKYLGISPVYGPHLPYVEKHRIPTFEELQEGMELEILTSYGWIKGTWPEVLGEDTHVNLFGGDTLLSKFNYADLRILK